MFRRLLLNALCAASLAGPATAAQGPDTSVIAQIGALEAAKQRKAFAETVILAARLLETDRAHPALRAAYARALAGAGREVEALAEVGWLATHGYGLDPRAARDLGAILSRPQQAALAARLAANAAPKGGAGDELKIRGETPFGTEGVDYDRKRGRYYVSASTGQVFAVGADGVTSTVYAETRPGRATYGVRLDAARDRLLICSNRAEGPEGRGGAELVILSLASGATERLAFDGAEADHICNDVAVLDDGRAVITDTTAGKLWLHTPGQELRPFSDVGFVFPNGIAIAPARRQVFVADFLGVWALDLQGRLVGRVEPGEGEYLGGVDGLYLVGDRLIAVQNTTMPERVVAADLRRGLDACVSVLASGQPRLEGMTTAALVEGRLAVLSRTGVGGAPPAPGAGPALVWLDLPAKACG